MGDFFSLRRVSFMDSRRFFVAFYLPLCYKVNMTFGKRLKELRIDRECTQAALAEAVGIDMSALSRMETGQRLYEPNRMTIERLAVGLALTVAESDELHALAGRIPVDVEEALIARPALIALVREKGKQ